ncbi:DUF3397 family protein [Brevibacillus fluminis]|uniref:DUF3397 family protein n=1 Tax=Brevibacillus fluminis TaxID=511487 RepID=UPI003F892698
MAIVASIWSYFWAVLTALPIVGFVLVYAIAFFVKKNHRDALTWSITISNFLLIRAVAAAYGVIWPDAMSVWLWIVLLFLGIAVLIGWMQIKVRGKISLSKIGFSTWRITFVLFGLAYIMLLSTGIWKSMQFV